MSKGVKTLISIGAALAVPFVAPAIAASFGTSMVVSSALAGAGLQAAAAAATGGDVGRAALMGGIGGGLYGYMAGPAAAATAQPAIAAGTGAPMSAAAPRTFDAATGAFVPAAAPAGMSYAAGMEPVLSSSGYMLPQATGTMAALAPSTATAVGAGFESAIPEVAFGATPAAAAGITPPPEVAFGATPAATSAAPVVTPTSGLNIPQSVAATPTGAAAAAAGAPKTFAEALSRVPGEVAAKFRDPKALADLTLRAAGQLAGAALVGSGLSPEEEALLAAQRQDLENLRQTNQQLFQQKLDQAQALLGEARYFDPNYFRQQAETAAKVNIGRQQQAATRGQTGAQREFTERQYQLGAARIAPTAGLQAAGQAQQARLQTMQAGLQQIPTSGPTVDYSRLMAGYETADVRRRKDQELVGELFGGLTGSKKSKSTGGG